MVNHTFNTTPLERLQQLKSSSLHMFLHGNISVDLCAKELFQPSKDSTSLHVCNEKNILGFRFFVNDIISGVALGLFSPLHLAFGSNR